MTPTQKGGGLVASVQPMSGWHRVAGAVWVGGVRNTESNGDDVAAMMQACIWRYY